MPVGIAIPQKLAGQGKPPKGPLGLTAGIQQGQSPLQRQRAPHGPLPIQYPANGIPFQHHIPAFPIPVQEPHRLALVTPPRLPLCPAVQAGHLLAQLRWQGLAGILQQTGQLFRRGEVEIDRHFCQPLQHLAPISDSLLQEIPGQGPLGRELYIGHAQLSPAAKNTGSKRNGALACA